MSLERRGFLKAAVALPALPSWTAGLSRGAQDDARPGANVERAHQRAREVGKPLLVLLIPYDDPSRAAQAETWSHLMAVADDATLAELALCEVVCAHPADVTLARPKGAAPTSLDPEDVAVLIEIDGEPARSISGAGLPGLESVDRFGSGEDSYDASARRRAAVLAERVRRAILPDAETLERRRATAEASLGMMKRMSLSLAHEPRPRLAHLDRGAALVLGDARSDADAARAATKESNLARAALQRLWEEAPEGALWQTSTGYCPPCGMGYIPTVSQHFLSFLAK